MTQRTETSPTLLSGVVPPVVDSYPQRLETGPDLRSHLRPGEIVVLTQGEKTVAAPAGQGGTGTTQLAAEYARAAWTSRTADLIAWVTATGREAIISGYAHAADTVGAALPEDDAETAAARFVRWLAHTKRPWVLVLDNLTAASDLEDLWPAGPAGRVIVTTALTEPALRETAAGHRQGVRIVPGSGFSRRESVFNLVSWLTADQQLGAIDLAEDLDDLPLGLAQATAVMSVTGLGCREYRTLLGERRKRMPAVPGVSAALLATPSLAADCGRCWVSAASACPPSPACPQRCWPPRRWPPTARTGSSRKAWRGPPWRWPPCSIRTGSRRRCSPARPRAATSPASRARRRTPRIWPAPL